MKNMLHGKPLRKRALQACEKWRADDDLRHRPYGAPYSVNQLLSSKSRAPSTDPALLPESLHKHVSDSPGGPLGPGLNRGRSTLIVSLLSLAVSTQD